MNFIIVLLFIMCIFNITSTVAAFKGIKYVINDPSCTKEIEGVKSNVKLTKIVFF